MSSNEPYQRVSQENNPFDGALIGAAIGAGGATAGVFGARMHYNGIDNRVKRQINRLEKQLNRQMKAVDRAERSYNRYVGDRDIDITDDSLRQRMAEKLGTEPELSRVNERKRAKARKKFNRYYDALDDAADTAKKLSRVSSEGYADSLRRSHVYSRMGGWRNAAIIGASAIIGGGLGMLIDEMANQ